MEQDPALILGALFAVLSLWLLGRIAGGIETIASELRRLRVIAEGRRP